MRQMNLEEPYPFDTSSYNPMSGFEAESLYQRVKDMESGLGCDQDAVHVLGVGYLEFEDSDFVDAGISAHGDNPFIDPIAERVAFGFCGRDFNPFDTGRQNYTIFNEGVYGGIWLSDPDGSKTRSQGVYASKEMRDTFCDDIDQEELFNFAQRCLDFVYENDRAYHALIVKLVKDSYAPESNVPFLHSEDGITFLYGAALGRAIYMFRQADIAEETLLSWEKYEQENICWKIHEQEKAWEQYGTTKMIGKISILQNR